MKAVCGSIFLGVVTLCLCNCAGEPERQIVLPQSSENTRPWNDLRPGEGQGALGQFQQR